MSTSISFVTALCPNRPERTRTIGFFHEIHLAKLCVENCDINENDQYPQIVIEVIEEGFFHPRKPVAGDGKFVPCSPFPGHERIVSYCFMG